LIHYRHYTTKQMIEILNRERIYFSRRNPFTIGLQNPDTITLHVQIAEGGFHSGSIVVNCEVHNNAEGVRNILQLNHFNRGQAEGSYHKTWTIPFKNTQDSINVIERAKFGIKSALQAAPFFLYASNAYKAVNDYYQFMKSTIPKISHDEVMRYLGYWMESTILNKTEDVFDTGTEFLIAQYSKERWAAWANGDHIVPLFLSESEALQFLKARSGCIAPFSQILIKTVPAAKNRILAAPYKLIDHSRSTTERVAWLQEEIARLRGCRENREII